ncbi:hypothetical protein DY000_02033423 [Brassica cretica]|uniref:Uncharacterized protein n=1 Tax=Brassica cretica TaxID=69181 RepID=A0ABQ7DZA2_BRACR|nr:hypothetical protein DY000_02033423 [Brassica cretica]
MGNIIMVRRKKATVMKIDGDTFRLQTPARVSDATKEYPGFVLFDSESVKRYGVRVKPLEPNHILAPNKTYFLVELPNLANRNKLPFRRVMSVIHVSAKERLEMLMLSRRAVSDVALARSDGGNGIGSGQTRVSLKLPRSQIMRLMGESHDASEVTERIIALYRESSGEIQGGQDSNDICWELGAGDLKNNYKAREKHVSFAENGGRGEIVVL